MFCVIECNKCRTEKKMEAVGIELTTYRMRSDRSTTELCPLVRSYEEKNSIHEKKLFSYVARAFDFEAMNENQDSYYFISLISLLFLLERIT